MRFIGAIACALLFQLTHIDAMAQAAADSGTANSGLTRLLEAELSRLPTKSGIYVKHLGTGEEASVRGAEELKAPARSR